MEFIRLDFNTVFSEVYEFYEETDKAITNDFKAAKMLEILQTKIQNH